MTFILTQGRCQLCHSMGHICFSVSLPFTLLHRFQDIIAYFSKFKDAMWLWLCPLKGKFVVPVLIHYIANQCTLKLIDHLHATRWTPPDYWQTDNSNGLVMVIRNYHWLNSLSRVLISTCSAPLVQTGERKQFLLFDRDLWPTTLTYNPRLAKVKVDPRAKNQGQKSNGSNRRVPTGNGRTRTHTRTLPNVLSPLRGW